MKKTTIVMTALLGLSTTLFAGGFGGKHCQNHKRYPKHNFYQVMKQLKLSDAQKVQFWELRKSQREVRMVQRRSMRAKRAKMVRKNRDLSQFMTAKKFDKRVYKALIRKRMEQRDRMRTKRRKAMIEKRAENMEKVFNILTPEQREKWIQLSKRQ